MIKYALEDFRMMGGGSDPDITHDKRPWGRLPPDTVNVIEPLQQKISDEIVEAIGREIPAYTRPLRGEFGDTVRTGVEQALEQFAEMVRRPGASREAGRRLYVGLGRGEFGAGRSIGALLAAYRIGARVAWRELGAAGLSAGLPQTTLNLLAESIFAYIDELSAESAEGYALEQAEHAGELDMRRGELIELLLRDKPPADARTLMAAADAAAWKPPEQLAVLVWRGAHGRAPAARLPQDVIVTAIDQDFCAIVPDPDAPGRRKQLAGALRSRPSAIGPLVELARAARSYEHALAALRLGEERGAPGLVFADEHRVELICRGDPLLAAEIERDLLACLDGETPHSRARLRETLLAWLRHDGNVPATAAELHVHTQTVRYRMHRLRELLGDALDGPDTRFELEFALRAGS
ncbi:MAG: helix-turn-helix domain-containing protein [Thermoleophilia bacterium]|nr:helix-turn-helix domain-containing protein [Thermoleophilia bacterium]